MSEKQKDLIKYIIKTILSKVTKIEAKIHKLTLYTKLNDNQIDLIFGKKINMGKIVPNKFCWQGFTCGRSKVEVRLNRHYDNITRKYDGFTRVKLFIPYVDENYSLNKLISKLLTTADRVNVSEVEYTIDFVCSGPNETRNLFFLFSHYAYIPHVRDVSNINESVEKNMTLYYYTNNVSNKRNAKLRRNERCGINRDVLNKRNAKLRCYERCGINRVPEGGFDFVDLDRLRIEFPVKRTKLKKYDISTLDDLIIDTKFADIIFNGHFKNLQFKKPKMFKDNPLAEIRTFLNRYNRPRIYSLQNQYIKTCGTSKSRDFIDNNNFSNFIIEIKKAVNEYKFDCLKISRLQFHNKS